MKTRELIVNAEKPPTRFKTWWRFIVLPVLTLLSTFNGQFATLHAQGTAFTYQGRLQSGGGPANGTYDLSFTLFSASSGGTPIAGPVINSAVTITNPGLFTSTVDFGPGVFTGGSNWLEIAVRITGGPGPFTTLAPRQQVTPAPYALYAGNATMLANGVAIGSGMGNLIAPGSSPNSFIGGGNANNILPGSMDSAIVGGQGNFIQPNAAMSFIGGGMNNQSASPLSVIGGGSGNFIGLDAFGAPTTGATIGGGIMNSNSASFATVSGGLANSASGLFAAIGGGSNNVASGYASVVGGGDPNYALSPFTGVLGGAHNEAVGDHATVGGGSFDLANGVGATVAGGQQNDAIANYATISGGSNNVASGITSTVGGGEQNTASATEATVSGGSQNTAGGADGTVGGGYNNSAGGQYGTVPGGYQNSANGLASFAAGYKAAAGPDNSFVWSDGGTFFSDIFGHYNADFNNQFKIQAQNGVRIDVSGSHGISPAALFVNSTSANGVGLYVLQTNSSDAAVVINTDAALLDGVGDLIKGFGWSPPVGFGTPNALVFEVTAYGDVTGHSFNSTSDRNAKENFATISPAEVLQKVSSIPISQWNFKGQHQDVQHIGPMAQDFHAAFGLNGADDKHISLTDEGGVALAAIQGLNQKLDEKDAEIQTLKQQNEMLENRLNDLEQAVKSITTTK